MAMVLLNPSERSAEGLGVGFIPYALKTATERVI